MKGYAKTLLGSAVLTAVAVTGLGVLTLSAQAESAEERVNSLYNKSCATCHAAGVLGAPRTGDVDAWKQRLAKGMPTLVSHTKNGYKNMPARGLCNSCSDEDYAALINKMASQ